MAKTSTVKGNGFVHLHVHSHYSLLDGACSIKGLLDRAVANDMGALAITDHGNMFGALEFYRVARGRGVKPIIGTEAYVAPSSRHDRKRARGQENYWHMLLLAKNATGYANLVKLASAAYKEGFYYRPRIDKELLRQYGEGLIATSGCLQGEVNQALLRGDFDAAVTAAKEYREIFGKGNFYLEVQDHGIEEQRKINPGIRELGNKLKIPLVATNDLHYLDKGHAHAHDVLLCIATGKLYNDPARWRFDGEEFWFKGEAEMRTVLPQFHDAIDHTVEIASKCDLEIKLGEARFPPYKSGKSISNEKYLRQLCVQGLKERYGASPSPEAKERLDHELEVIKASGFLDYFLVVWDLIHAARGRGIPMGPGRGSAAGSLVAYVLRITDVCPLKYDLLFDRFLNAARNEPPDIDIDICQAGRGEMIEYLREKYGRDNTAQIITFGTLAARRAVRDVGRVLDVPLNEVDRIAKLIPATPGMKLKDAPDASPDLKEALAADSRAKQLYGLSEQLEGLARNAGTHAAAIVISDRPLDEEVPLYVKDGEVSTQYQMNDVGALGLLKLDLLGLETLTALEECLRVIEEVHGTRPELPVDQLDDPKVFELLQRGESTGLFQLESDGMRTLLKQLKPDCFEDIIAVLALYRPGPLGSGMVESYVKRKHGEEKIKYLHKRLEPILSETNGVILYQEQVMRIANRVAGFSLSEADTLRKAMGKKKVAVMDKFAAQFLAGCEANDVPRAIGQEIWDQMVYFAGYGFNKCVVGETRVVDADDGSVHTVAQLFRSRRPTRVHALGADWRLAARRVADVVWNGRKPVFELTTRLGNRITATGNHPFRTLNGWTTLEHLRPGDRLAAPRRMAVAAREEWAEHEVVVAAGLIAEGNTCHPSTLYFFGNARALVADFADAAAQFPDTVARVTDRDDGRFEVAVNLGSGARISRDTPYWDTSGPLDGGPAVVLERRRCGAFLWAESLGLTGKRAAEKRVPASVFRLSDRQVALFAGRLWAGDGYLAGSGGHVPFYATSSPGLGRDVQALLLRLGMPSRLAEKSFRYRGERRPGFTVHLIGEGTIDRFIEVVGRHIVGRDAQLERLRTHRASVRAGRSSRDTIPAEVRAWVDAERRAAGLEWRDLEAQSGVSIRELCRRPGAGAKRGFRRHTLRRLAEFFGSRPLEAISNSDVFWDEVESIEPRGVQDTFDLEVDGDHNFVADGLIVHNSHSTAYGLVSYQTAWVKAHYPAEFIAAMMTIKRDNTDRLMLLAADCRTFGIALLPPDVSESRAKFFVTPGTGGGAGHIRFGLSAVKGVGAGAAEALEAAAAKYGPFKHLVDITENVDLATVNKSALEALILSGAMDSIDGNRAQLAAALEEAVSIGQSSAKDKARGQGGLFGDAAKPPPPPLPIVPPWPEAKRLADEKELTGLYHSSHPLARYTKTIETFSSASVLRLKEMDHKAEVTMGGLLRALRLTVTKSGRDPGKRMALFELEDMTGVVKCVIFPRDFERARDFIADDQVVFIRASVDQSREDPNLKVADVMPIARAREILCKRVVINLRETQCDQETVNAVSEAVRQSMGNTPVYLRIHPAKGEPSVVKAGYAYGVSANEAFERKISEAIGADAVEYL